MDYVVSQQCEVVAFSMARARQEGSYLTCQLIDPGFVFKPLLAVPSSRVLDNSKRLNFALRATCPAASFSIAARQAFSKENAR